MEETTNLVVKGTLPEVLCDLYSDGEWEKTSTQIPDEIELALFINNQELVRILCTPIKLNCLVIGFLYSQGIINKLSDIASLRVCEDDLLADIKLSNPDYKLPTMRTLTSGCGGGATFVYQGQKIDSDLTVSPSDIITLMKYFLGQMELYRFCGGVHASALADRKSILVCAEDIGRHNTLDKIQGESILRKISTKDKILLSTGRVSSEMLLKAAKMQVTLVVSRSSPTGRAVTLANDLGITLIGYARSNRMTVYSHPERITRL